MTDEPDFNEDDFYDLFPNGDDFGYGPDQGFNTWVRLNNESLFTEEAKAIPAIRAFIDAPIEVTYAQFKSSYRESEYFIHKPIRAMTGEAPGIEGNVGKIQGVESGLPTLVINHDKTLARHITRALVITDATSGGQVLHKEPAP